MAPWYHAIPIVGQIASAIEGNGNSEGPKQEQKTTSDVYKTFTEVVNSQLINNFTTNITNTSKTLCQSSVVQNQNFGVITMKGKGARVNIGNNANVDMSCMLRATDNNTISTALTDSLKKAVIDTLSVANSSDFNAKSSSELFGGNTGPQTSISTSTLRTDILNDVTKIVTNTISSNLTNEKISELKSDFLQTVYVAGLNMENEDQQFTSENIVTARFVNQLIGDSINTISNEVKNSTELSSIMNNYLDNYNKSVMSSESKGLGSLVKDLGSALSKIIGALSLNNPILIIGVIVGLGIVLTIILSIFKKNKSNDNNANLPDIPRFSRKKKK